MKLLLKQSEEIIDAADTRFRFTPGERRFLLGALKGEGLLFARGGRWPMKIEASPAEHRLATTNPRELAELGGVDLPAAPGIGAVPRPAKRGANGRAGRSLPPLLAGPSGTSPKSNPPTRPWPVPN